MINFLIHMQLLLDDKKLTTGHLIFDGNPNMECIRTNDRD